LKLTETEKMGNYGILSGDGIDWIISVSILPPERTLLAED